MKIYKLIIGTLTGTIIYFVVGWIVFDFLLGSYTNTNDYIPNRKLQRKMNKNQV